MRSSRHLIGTVGRRGQPAASQLAGCHGQPATQKDFNSVMPHLLLYTPLWRVHKRVLGFPSRWAGLKMAPASQPAVDPTPLSSRGRPAHTRPSCVHHPITSVCSQTPPEACCCWVTQGPPNLCREYIPRTWFSGGSPAAGSGKEPTHQSRRRDGCGFSPRWGRSPGGGQGTPLQSSCLGHPMDRGAWWAAVLGVAESQT